MTIDDLKALTRSAGGRIWLAAILLTSLTGAAPTTTPRPTTARQNVLLISLDTARADHFHCYGYPLKTTPSVDRLASEGVLFLNAFTQAVNTVPSHATLFTGLYPSGHGSRLNGQPLNPEFDTLAEILSRAGYRTAAFVSGNTMVASQSGFNQGFDVYEEGFTGQDRKAEDTVNLALAWLRGLPKDASYFLFVHLFDPHGKYEPPPGHAERFRTGRYPLIDSIDAIPEYQRIDLGEKGISRDPLDYISRYDGEIHYADSQMGRLLSAVGADTIVTVVADHGETLVDRDYYFSHGARLNEEAIRIPFLLRLPDSRLRGKRISGPAQMIDLLPTLLSAIGRPVPPRLPGRNLLPFIRLGTIPWGRAVMSEARARAMNLQGTNLAFLPGSTLIAARDERTKLIQYPARGGTLYEAFDLGLDPQEKHDLSSKRPPRSLAVYQALDLYLLAGRPPEPPELDDETKKKLRSLGYVD